jgi:hypothetical protein
MKLTLRNFHIWTGLAFGLPLFLVGCTTFFIAHEKGLGLKEIFVATGSLPKMREPLEIRSSLRFGDEIWVGAGNGVFKVKDGRASPIEGGPRDEIRDMAAADDTVLLAGKKGLWRYDRGASSRLYAGDCWEISVESEGVRAACKGAGLIVSKDKDRLNWNAMTVNFPAEATISSGVPLSKIIMDLHTGKLILGDSAKWFWIDVLGASMIGWTVTGLVMWMRGRRARVTRTRRLMAAQAGPAE